MNELAIQRLRIINLYRYFLTKNRSSNQVVKAFCKQRVKAHKIQEKYNHFHNILISFETYINTLSTISQTRGSKAVKKTLNILAFFAIPLGIFGAIMQLSTHNDIIEKPQLVLTNLDLWFWIAFSFIAPMLLLGTGYAYDRYVQNKHK